MIEFTDEQLDYMALLIIQTVHIYALPDGTPKEKSFDYKNAMSELRYDAWMYLNFIDDNTPYSKIMDRIERMGKENGYWE